MYDHSPILILEWKIVIEVKYTPSTLSPPLQKRRWPFSVKLPWTASYSS